MSRSYKKKAYGFWVCCTNDKDCRTIYHRNRRRKDKSLCKKVDIDFPEEDDFVKENIDHSVRFSDKCIWNSDGGNFFKSDISSLRKEFDEEVFGINATKDIWIDYQKNRKDALNKEPREYIIFFRRIVPYIDKESGFVFKREEKTKITTKKYPPYTSYEELGIDTSWEVTGWKAIRKRNAFSNWNLMGFLFRNNLIPLNLGDKEELISWLRENEEDIIKKWLKAQYLRK